MPIPSLPRALVQPVLVIGEGKEDCLVLVRLLAEIGLGNVQVEAYNGKDKLGAYLKELPKRTGFENVVSLGITRDADTNASAARASVEAARAAARMSNAAFFSIGS